MKKGFDSIGFIDFGNDDLWEVFAPVNLPKENPDGFVHNNFEVFLASHSNIDHEISLMDFLHEYDTSPHLNEILIQIGMLLMKRIKEGYEESPFLKHPTSPLESSVDAAAEWSIDAAIAERAERDRE